MFDLTYHPAAAHCRIDSLLLIILHHKATMPTLRSSSREDEVVVPSQRQSSLRSQSNSPSRKNTRNSGPSNPKRSYEDDEIEVSPAPKKRTRREKLTAKASKKAVAKKPLTLDHFGAGHLDNTTTEALNDGRIGSYPTPEPSSESDSRDSSPEANMMASEKKPTIIYDLPAEVSQLSHAYFKSCTI